ncbi:MAG: hypothetical protein ACYTEQ_22580 [Planctomycetota bacterium]
MAKRGMEELEGGMTSLGSYLQQFPGGRCIVLRGKYKGAYADTIPRGYIRKFILVKWRDDLTPAELALFEEWGKTDEEKNNE